MLRRNDITPMKPAILPASAGHVLIRHTLVHMSFLALYLIIIMLLIIITDSYEARLCYIYIRSPYNLLVFVGDRSC